MKTGSASSNPELEEPQSGTAASESSEATLFLSEEDSTCESESCTVAEQCDTTVSPSTAPNAPETSLVPSEESETTTYSVSHVEPEGNTITANPSVSCNAVCCTNLTKPNQPTNQAFLATTKQQVGIKDDYRSINPKWCQDYKWLHVCVSRKKFSVIIALLLIGDTYSRQKVYRGYSHMDSCLQNM